MVVGFAVGVSEGVGSKSTVKVMVSEKPVQISSKEDIWFCSALNQISKV